MEGEATIHQFRSSCSRITGGSFFIGNFNIEIGDFFYVVEKEPPAVKMRLQALFLPINY